MKPLCLAMLCAGGLPAVAVADALTPQQYATIKAAYAEASSPMTERLSGAQFKVMQVAYATHDPAPMTDALTPQRMAMMHRSYDTHNVSEGFELASN